jgi:hypothetical protein
MSDFMLVAGLAPTGSVNVMPVGTAGAPSTWIPYRGTYFTPEGYLIITNGGTPVVRNANGAGFAADGTLCTCTSGGTFAQSANLLLDSVGRVQVVEGTDASPDYTGVPIAPDGSLYVTNKGGPVAALDLNFLTGTTLDSRITFTRASNATFINSSGLVALAASDAPRFDYDPITLAARGLLIEEQRTNLLTYSEDFSNWSVGGAGTTVTANSAVAPDGASTADEIIVTAGSSSSRFASATTTNAVHTLSFWIRSGTSASCSFGVYTTAFVTATGSIVYGSGAIAGTTLMTVTGLTSSWTKITLTTSAAVPAGSTSVFFYPGGTPNAAGNSIYIWGAQLEAGAFATSYIPTVAAQVTRAADNASMTGTNFSSWYNQTEGTLAVDFRTGWPVTTGPRIAELSAGTGARVVDLYFSGGGFTVYNGTMATGGTAGLVANTNYKVAAAYKTASYAYVRDGGTVFTDSSALVNTANTLYIGRFNDGSNSLNGHIRSIRYYNTRLPNTTLQGLTA